MCSSLLDEIKQGSRWIGKDAFPSTLEWKLEVEKWLIFIKQEGQFQRFLPRLQDIPRKRDEALAEISAAYFIKRIKGYPILEWQPVGAENKTGEFSFQVANEYIVFSEVKSPGWEADVVRNKDDLGRLDKPKYINGEAAFFNNAVDIRYAIQKAYPKFIEDKLNLLIIVDDLRVSLSEDRWGAEEALYYKPLKTPYCDTKSEGCFVSTGYNRLGGLATLNVEQTKEINYRWKLYKNPNAIISLPDNIQ